MRNVTDLELTKLLTALDGESEAVCVANIPTAQRIMDGRVLHLQGEDTSA